MVSKEQQREKKREEDEKKNRVEFLSREIATCDLPSHCTLKLNCDDEKKS